MINFQYWTSEETIYINNDYTCAEKYACAPSKKRSGIG